MNSVDIILNSLSTSQIALLITSSCIQILILLGYIRSFITKKSTLQVILFPLLFLCLILTSISFGIRPDVKIKNNEGESKEIYEMKYINIQIFMYIIIIIIFCILILAHYFIKNLLLYKNTIHFWTVFLICISIILSVGLISIHGNQAEIYI